MAYMRKREAKAKPSDRKINAKRLSVIFGSRLSSGKKAMVEPLVSVEEHGGIRVITEISINEEGKRVKTVRKVRLVMKKQKANAAVAERKKWAKFGGASSGKASFDDGITSLGEECELKLMSTEEKKAAASGHTSGAKEQAKKPAISAITCRVCKGDHWTTKCPYKDTLQPLEEILDSEALSGGASAESLRPGSQKELPQPLKPGSYVPPSMRGKQAGSSVAPQVLTRRQIEEDTTIRIANLSDDTEEQDVRRLCEGFGPLARVFLSKDKETGRCKGFAFVCYRYKEDAAKAIRILNGRGFDNLILHVEWSNREANK